MLWTAEEIRQLRRELGLTIDQFAGKTGLSGARIAALENGAACRNHQEALEFTRLDATRTLVDVLLAKFDRDRGSMERWFQAQHLQDLAASSQPAKQEGIFADPARWLRPVTASFGALKVATKL